MADFTRTPFTGRDYDALVGRLTDMAEEAYRDFNARIIPDTAAPMLGVRLPALKSLAKQIAKGDWNGYLSAAQSPRYYEEILLQGLVLGFLKEPTEIVMEQVRAFVPRIDNWAVCDSTCMGLKTVAKHREEWRPFLGELLSSENPWAVRMGLVLLLSQCLTSDTVRRILEASGRVKSEHYYVRMANAWLVSVCYVKFPDETGPFLHDCPLDDWTYNKALQKITESYRVTPEQKAYIRSLKRPKKA